MGLTRKFAVFYILPVILDGCPSRYQQEFSSKCESGEIEHSTGSPLKGAYYDEKGRALVFDEAGNLERIYSESGLELFVRDKKNIIYFSADGEWGNYDSASTTVSEQEILLNLKRCYINSNENVHVPISESGFFPEDGFCIDVHFIILLLFYHKVYLYL